MIFPHCDTARFTSWKMMTGKIRPEELAILTAVPPSQFSRKNGTLMVEQFFQLQSEQL
jgi:hypothetical protein